jgi:hypothetical protein
MVSTDSVPTAILDNFKLVNGYFNIFGPHAEIVLYYGNSLASDYAKNLASDYANSLAPYY